MQCLLFFFYLFIFFIPPTSAFCDFEDQDCSNKKPFFDDELHEFTGTASRASHAAQFALAYFLKMYLFQCSSSKASLFFLFYLCSAYIHKYGKVALEELKLC